MNKAWEDFIDQDLEERKKTNSFRSLRSIRATCGREIDLDGRKLINFASNDYLGLANDERVIEAGYSYAKRWGAGSGASRLISGTTDPVIETERRLAEWTLAGKALLFNSGYQANVGVITALADKNTVIFNDKLNHASIYDGIAMSNAKMVRYKHADAVSLEEVLEKHKDAPRKIIVTDTVFSMEGDIAPLKEIVELARKYGAMVIADEAHAFGVFGRYGRGLCITLGVQKEIDIGIGTLGKGFGVFGAFVLASGKVIDFLVNNSRSFIFTTALPPFVVGAVTEALEIIKSEPRGEFVLKKAEALRKRLMDAGVNIGRSESQIIPVITRSSEKAIHLMNHLHDNGFFCPAIRPPTVPPNSARVRLSVCYHHSEEDIERIASCIKKWMQDEG